MKLSRIYELLGTDIEVRNNNGLFYDPNENVSMAYNVLTIQFLDKSSSKDNPVYISPVQCTNDSDQELVEDRIIRSIQGVIDDSILYVTTEYVAGSLHWNLDARIVYIPSGSVFQVKDNDLHMVYFTGHEECNKISVRFTTEPGQPMRVESIAAPKWLNQIIQEAELYENPLNQQFVDEVTFHKPPHDNWYWGQYLYYISGETAIIKIDGLWYPVPYFWLLSNIDKVHPHIREEWTLAQQYK
ncbi:hypothetical protein D3C78_20530 [compost metagenome]